MYGLADTTTARAAAEVSKRCNNVVIAIMLRGWAGAGARTMVAGGGDSHDTYTLYVLVASTCSLRNAGRS